MSVLTPAIVVVGAGSCLMSTSVTMPVGSGKHRGMDHAIRLENMHAIARSSPGLDATPSRGALVSNSSNWKCERAAGRRVAAISLPEAERGQLAAM